jgi:hypothetical protein
MELEAELDKHLGMDDSENFYEKSSYGYGVIGVIEGIEEGVRKGHDEAKRLNEMNVTPPYLKQIVQDYSLNSIDLDGALGKIGEIKTKVSNYLITKGYDYRYYQLWEDQLMCISDKEVRDYKRISSVLDKMKESSDNGVSEELRYQLDILKIFTEHMWAERIKDKERISKFEKAMIQIKV